ncbi:MAG: hypothetical protein IM333_16645 [Microcystis sp. M048S1]|nr:hypothetical protein [Microcystis sp. M176S2]MCA2727095.1 hypothetical protein [Microcystis sp. M166S2]MCA2730508.1 hypothetical protein [Microcystis sp. M162S2]MCA2745221.1 hypothetical protein [Microcystis sp. M155S2]MCA2767778.1 hypothetical protein [Microcystis sp. M152S2]MCA2778053.1 hypothetical protein [Microcystis sp. M136S2]MCA2783567.1 hypothetical protein [Microcystis sp. M125S2]MCA2790616.1 hypothetical protein [Microcystis sp. M112S2]MCA2800862.1 hypothetical protein [Microc
MMRLLEDVLAEEILSGWAFC